MGKSPTLGRWSTLLMEVPGVAIAVAAVTAAGMVVVAAATVVEVRFVVFGLDQSQAGTLVVGIEHSPP
jgi:hypothetical protein